MTPDDAELLRRYVREGASDAFGELVQRHVGMVYHAALRQIAGDLHQAEEAVQEVFTILARRAPSVTEHPMLIGWLFSTIRQVSCRLLRTEQRRRQREHAAWDKRRAVQAVPHLCLHLHPRGPEVIYFESSWAIRNMRASRWCSGGMVG